MGLLMTTGLHRDWPRKDGTATAFDEGRPQYMSWSLRGKESSRRTLIPKNTISGKEKKT